MSIDEAPSQYLYESDVDDAPAARRTSGDAKEDALTLLRKLDVDPAIILRLAGSSPSGGSARAVKRTTEHDANTDATRVSDLVAWELLVRYATDVLLNIRWYKRAKRKQEWRQRRWIAGATLIGLLTVALPLGFLLRSIIDPRTISPPGLLEAQLGVMVAAVGSGWKFISGLANAGQRMSIFWQAYADLNEEIISLEGKWKGRAADGLGLSSDFLGDLQLSLQRAHLITWKERQAFFATYAAPSQIVSSATTSAAELTAAVTKLENAKREEAVARSGQATKEAADRLSRETNPDYAGSSLDERIAAARSVLVNAEAELALKTETLAAIQEHFPKTGGLDDANVTAAKAAVAAAMTAEIKAAEQVKRLAMPRS